LLETASRPLEQDYVAIARAIVAKVIELCDREYIDSPIHLDGLNEMSLASGNPLSEIARQIREGGSISKATIVLTCRVNLWDGSSNALNKFDTYRTLDFSYPQQVEEFIGRWFGSQAQIEQGQRLCHALNEPGKERIRDLVKNPLRLTLLCFDWFLREGKLPETKAELYKQFVTDLYELKEEEFPTSYEEREQLNAKLAELSREAIDKEKNRFLLRHEFVCRFLGYPDEKGSSFDLALKLGFLNKVGRDDERPRETVYAFFHATFEEYFAALAIDEWDFFLPSQHINRPVVEENAGEYKPYRIFEPQWKEVILLWLGREDEKLREQKEKFIQALVEFADGCGNFYGRRAYFLAAAGIAEFGDCSKADEIVEQIVEWGFGSFNIEEQKWVRCVEPSITEEARAVLLETERTKAINTLVKLLQIRQSTDTLRVLVKSLEKIGSGNTTAINALVKLFQKSLLALIISKRAAESSKETDSGNHTVRDAQLSSFDKFMSFLEVSWSLEKIGSGNTTAIIALELLIQKSESEDIHRQMAERLERIDSGNPKVIEALESTRLYAAESLGKIDSSNRTAINTLESLIQNSESDEIRMKAAWQLKNILGEAQMVGVITVLKDYLSNETYENDYERYKPCYEIVWHCAQTLPYPTFYQVWHHPLLSPHPDVTETTCVGSETDTQSINLAEFPKLLWDKLDQDSDLRDKVQLICINGSKFVERNNPATKIYHEMRRQGCPNYWDGKPRTMAQLQDYLDELRLDSDRTLVLVFYENPIAAPQGFSETFLDDLSRFGGAICAIGNQPNIPLRSFSPNQHNLVVNVVEWIGKIVLENP
jgi:hypothetical protein